MKEKILPIVEPLATGFILKKKKKIESISLSPVIVNSHLSQVKVKVKSLSLARLFVTPWTAACIKLLRPWDFLGKSTGVGCSFLLQGIFLTQGSNPGLLHCRQTLYPLSHTVINKQINNFFNV